MKWIHAFFLGKKGYLLFWGILLLSVIIRTFLLFTETDEAFFHNDGMEYRDIAAQLYAGNGFSINQERWYETLSPDRVSDLHPDLSRTPLLPLLGAALHFLPLPWILSAKLTCLILAGLSIWTVYLLGKAVSGPRAGRIAAMLFAVYPYSIYHSICWSTETLFTIFLTAAFTVLIQSFKGDFRKTIFCAVLLALATLTRPTAFLFLPVFGLFFLFWMIRTKQYAETIRVSVLCLLVFWLIMVPWMIRNWNVCGKPTPLTNYDGYAFWLSTSEIIYQTYQTLDKPEYTETVDRLWDRLHAEKRAFFREKGIYSYMEQANYWKQWGWQRLREAPAEEVWVLYQRGLHYFRMCPNLIAVSTPVKWGLRCYFSIVFALGIIGILRMRKKRVLWVLLTPPVYGLLISIPFLFVLRYRFPFFAPYLCVLASCGFLYCLNRIRKTSHF